MHTLLDNEHNLNIGT